MARLSLAQVYGDLSIDVPRHGHRFEWSATPIDLGPVVIFSGSITTDVLLRGDVRGYTISLAAGSDARGASSGGATEIAPGRSAAVFSPGGRCELRAAGPFRSSTMRIDPLFLAAQLEALAGTSPARPLEFVLSMSTALGAGALLERVCLFLTEDPERAERALRHPLVRTSLAETVAHLLLVGQPHDHAHLLERRAPPSSQTVVRRVEEYVYAHAAEAISAADLAALAGAPLASITAAFQAHRGTTPIDFLRHRRLTLARERLLLAGPGETIASVAHASGFLRPERFEAAYAAAFGESPAETKRRGLRAIEAPARSQSRARTQPPREANPPTVFLVRRDASRREASAELLREAGHAVQVFDSPLGFLSAARTAGAGCAVIDVHLPDLNGLEVRAVLRESGSALPVVLTSDIADVTLAVEAMKAGAVDFLVEPIDEAALLAAVARALARDAEARSARAEEEAHAARFAALSPRQREVCERAARGMLNKQIAAELGISASAVRFYRAEGMEKLGVGSAAELGQLMASWPSGGR